MSQFRPTRASPRPKHTNIPDPPRHKISADISRSSTTSAHEPLTLSREEIELIDSVIERAGPSATTFLTVFKAYNDVLTERGLDPHEVTYYGKLLKLGTMKGKNWGDKWSIVKSRYDYQGSSASQNHSHRKTDAPAIGRKNVSKRVIYRPKPLSTLDDTLTLHSHENESDASSAGEDDLRAPLAYHPPESLAGIQNSWGSPSFSDHALHISSPPVRNVSTAAHFRWQRCNTEESQLSDDSERVLTATPPSYHTTTRNSRSTAMLALASTSKASSLLATTVTSVEARKVVAKARENRGTILNEDDAWKKIKIQRDEVDADQFRADRLQERCWNLWKEGFHWIIVCSSNVRRQ